MREDSRKHHYFVFLIHVAGYSYLFLAMSHTSPTRLIMTPSWFHVTMSFPPFIISLSPAITKEFY